MKNILIIGAGRSATALIKYLLDHSETENLKLTVADLNIELAKKSTLNHPNATAISLNISDEIERRNAIEKADIVISMLPAFMHIEVAKDCITFKKNLVTASYISNEMRELDEEVKNAGLIFMNECGLDPGIDHMSAMKVLDKIREEGGKPIHFESFCGGLVAPESDNNLWNYKFTWNPRNVVLAGQGGAAKFLQQGSFKYIPYQRIFRRTEFLDIEGYGRFEAYANRDSLSYRKVYGLENAHTIYRGTIRRVGYSRAWNLFVQLGLTDDTYQIEGSENMTNREFINSFLYYHPTDSVEVKFRLTLSIPQDDVIWDKLVELDLFNDTNKIGLINATPAQILEKILADKWTLEPDDKDMIVMYHKFGYVMNGSAKQIDATMVCIGENQVQTAMAKTVGLPVAIATLLILNNKISTKGVIMPIEKEVYNPILEELEKYGIIFKEIEVPYEGEIM